MFCSKCGAKQVDEEGRFCHACGNAVVQQAAVPPVICAAPPTLDPTIPIVSPVVANALENPSLQYNKFHTPGGTGFAAEGANVRADQAHLWTVEVTGTTNELNGPDRIVDGVPVQTKYFPTANDTVNAAFDSGGGSYRYKGQMLEVPRDQYDESVKLMKEKIAEGKVPGVTDPEEAHNIIKKGDVTYTQARNIARAGNIDSLLYDAKTMAVVTGYVFALSFAIGFARMKWHGASNKDAVDQAIRSGLAAGGTAFVTGVVTAQVLRTRAAAVGTVYVRSGMKAVASTSIGRTAIEQLASASLGKAVSGAAAINHVSKLLRSNAITAGVATVVTSTPDFFRAAVSKSISWPQFTKNLIVNLASIAGGGAGWLGGAAVGAAAGSVVPFIGTAIGGVVGGIAGALAGGTVAGKVSKAAMDEIVEDDAKKMIALLQQAIEELAHDYLLSEKEIAELMVVVKAMVNPKWLKEMYQSGARNGSDEGRKRFAYSAFDSASDSIIRKRERILPPHPSYVQERIEALVNTA